MLAERVCCQRYVTTSKTRNQRWQKINKKHDLHFTKWTKTERNESAASMIGGEVDQKLWRLIRNSSGQSALCNFLDCNNDYARNEDCVIFYYVWFKYANNWYCRRRKYAKSSLSEVNNNILPDVPTKQDTNEEDVWFFTFSSRRWRLTHRWNYFS